VKQHLAFSLTAISNRPLGQEYNILYEDELYTFLQIIYKILFINQQLQTWRRFKTLIIIIITTTTTTTILCNILQIQTIKYID
jgi:hypothetical protein